jgi:phosphoribosylglycinamide formyltransferase-1
MFKIAVFASGGGSNFQSIVDKKKSGDLNIEFAFLMVNNSTCGAASKAQKESIPVIHMSSKTHSEAAGFDKELLSQLKENEVDLIVLAGYMKKIPDVIMEEYSNKILNIHPSLLPAFGGPGCYGMNVHTKVFERGARFTGMTVHLVSGGYDTGPILKQDVVEVEIDDTPDSIAQKVLKKEHEHYWQVVKAISEGRMIQKGDQFWLKDL